MTKQELEKLLEENSKIKDISRKTGLTVYKIYTLIKEYKIPLPNKKISKDQLYSLYVIDNLSSRQVAQYIGRSHQTIVNWLDKYQIKKKVRGSIPHPPPEISKEALSIYLNEFRSVSAISRHLKISSKSIKDLMTKYGLSKVKIDEEFLTREYLEKGKLVCQIAKECKVQDKTIYFYLKKFKMNKKSISR